ncbi:MAG: Asp-tRNA(Asn)/Glu-tRNA(Gln) amidotransferase subunit GatB [Desulfovibrionaceae bacterium]
MAEYQAVIGLEIHAQMTTRTKIFCNCSTEFGREPNTNVCPVCSGMPGVLPVMNEKVLEYACKMGLAVHCEINRKSVFARKNYFYPDLPKGYQTSQFELPICGMGHIDIATSQGEKRIGITRIHMEEDAGKSIHSATENVSFVDLNRAATPLLEIVSEPDMRSAEEAEAYLRALHSIITYLGICDGNMEQGSFRCDANVSIMPRGASEFGTRTELKNMNSFRNVRRAIEYEIQRQIDLVEDGEQVVQQTRLFDADKGVTHAMRGKEEAHDYRYFPCPDLVPMVLEEAWIERWRSELPELPASRRARFMEAYGLPEDDARLLTQERGLADYFEAAASAYAGEARKAANWMVGELLPWLAGQGALLQDCGLTPEHLAKLLALVDGGLISVKIGKDAFADLCASGEDPEAYVKSKGLVQESDSSALAAVVDEVIAENPAEAERVRGGDKKVVGFLMGQIMKKTKGKANPGVVTKLLNEKLS